MKPLKNIIRREDRKAMETADHSLNSETLTTLVYAIDVEVQNISAIKEIVSIYIEETL